MRERMGVVDKELNSLTYICIQSLLKWQFRNSKKLPPRLEGISLEWYMVYKVDTPVDRLDVPILLLHCILR